MKNRIFSRSHRAGARCLGALIVGVCLGGTVYGQAVPQITTTTLPTGQVGVPYPSQTLQATGADVPFVWDLSVGSPPPGLSLSPGGVISGTPTAEGTFAFTVLVTDNNLDTDTQSLTITVTLPLSITTTSLAPGEFGNVYLPQTLQATGGVEPYTWSVTGGLIPPGLQFSPQGGVIIGTPSLSGTFEFTVRVTDSAGNTATKGLSITVPLSVTTPTLPDGAEGQPYSSQVLTASPGGARPYQWSVAAGSQLPPGLSLSTAGVLSGTPTADGDFDFEVVVEDAAGLLDSEPEEFTIAIDSGLRITTDRDLPGGVASAFYSVRLETDRSTPVTWTLVSGTLPPGIALSPTGSLGGTPSAPGDFEFTLQAGGGTPPQTASRTFRLSIARALNIVTSPLLANATLSAPYSEALGAEGGRPRYTWTVESGRLPPGIALSADGVLAGTPTALGTFAFLIQVADRYSPPNQVATLFTLTVGTNLTISTKSLPNPIQGLEYSQQLEAAGGTAPLTWIVSGGTLPPGLELTAAGALGGTPAEPGSGSMTITVTDSQGVSDSMDFTLTVDPPIPSLSASSLPLNLGPREASGILIELAGPHPSPLSGELTLSFSSTAEVPVDDPMTRFSSGSRVVDFTIPAGSTAAVFSSETMLLTGTVAGTVRLSATFDDGPVDLQVASVSIVPTAPQITTLSAARTQGGLEVRITGYSPMRRVTNVEFVFDVRVGETLQKIALSRSVDADFASWYTSAASADFGSSFSFLQSFAVTGAGSAAVESVTVRLINAQGGSSFGPAAFE